MEAALRVVVRRGSEVESVHMVHAVLVLDTGPEERVFGKAGTRAFWRSSMKPFQTLPLVEDGGIGAFELAEEDLAVCCGSHYGMPRHVSRVERLLARLDLTEKDLICGPHLPYDEPSAHALLAAGHSPGRVHNNCSGKHVGMLALARLHDWPTEGYAGWDHPVQERVRLGVRRWLDSDPNRLPWAADGCGVPTPHLSLREMATAYARLSADPDEASRAVVRAMTAHPQLTSGPGALAARIMEVSGGRILAKEGAEAVLCLAGVDQAWGVAAKVTDGGKRAVGPAVITILESVGLLDASEATALESFHRTPIVNTEGRTVGRIEIDSRTAPSPA